MLPYKFIVYFNKYKYSYSNDKIKKYRYTNKKMQYSVMIKKIGT